MPKNFYQTKQLKTRCVGCDGVLLINCQLQDGKLICKKSKIGITSHHHCKQTAAVSQKQLQNFSFFSLTQKSF